MDSIAQKSVENYLAGIRRYAALYDPAVLEASDYTDTSWSAFFTARTAALELLESNGRFYTGMGVSEERAQRNAFTAFRSACVKLEQAKQVESVTVSVSDPYALRKGQDAIYDATQRLSFAPGTTLSQLLTQMDIPALSWAWDRDFAVYLNGVLYFDIDLISSGSYADDAYGDMLLRDGDEIVIARIAPPTVLDSSQMVSSAAQLQDASEYVRHQRVTPSKTTVSVGEPFTVTVEAAAAMPLDYTGEYAPVSGASVFMGTAAADTETAGSKPVDNNLLVKTGADGKATVTLYDEGWVLLNAFDLDSEYGSLTNGAAVFVHVVASDDLEAVKAALADELNATAADADYPETYFQDSDWTAIQTALTTGLEQIEAATDSGTARAKQLAAMQTITGLQQKADKYNAENLAAFYENLNKLPDDLDKLDAGAQDTVDALIAAYEAMTEYQLQQLSAADTARYNAIKAKADAGLDAATGFRLTVEYDLSGVPDADKAGLEAMISYLQEHVQTEGVRDALGGNRMGGLYSFNTVKGKNSGSDFTPVTSANGGAKLTFISSPAYATHILIRGKRSVDVNQTAYGNTDYVYTLADGSWTVTDTTTVFDTTTDIIPYKLYPERTYTVNGHSYEMRGVSYTGLDESAVTATSYGFYDFSDYLGKPDSKYFLAIPESALSFTMPYNDVTFTVKWAPVSGTTDEISAAKEAAAASINNAFEAYDQSKYSAGNYDLLTAAKTEGLLAVENAATLAEVSAARRNALAAMAAVKADLAGGTDPTVELPDYGSVIGQVYVSVENNTFPGGNFTGTILSGWYDLCQRDTMMTSVLKALATEGFDWTGTGSMSGDKYDITYLSSISKGGKKLAEFDGDSGSGWMGTLNDWFVSEGFNMFTVAGGTLGNGDIISVRYTQNLGADLGGTWNNSDTSLKALEIEGGTLVPGFDGGTLEYTLVIPGETANVKLTPTAANKNYLVKAFLNLYNNDAAFYKRTEAIPVKTGNTVYIGVGEKEWPSMNKFGDKARDYSGTRYTLQVVSAASGADYVNGLIAALPAAEGINGTNYEAVQQQISALDTVIAALDASEQEKVNTAALEAVRKAVNGIADVYALKDKIKAFPSDMKQATKDELQALVAAYDALTDAQKALLTVAETNKVERARAALDGIIQEETDAEKLATAKETIEDAADFTVAQATANDAAALKTYAEGVVDGLALDENIDENIAAVVTVSNVTPAVEGTAEDTDGTDGKYTVSVALTLNSSSDTATVTDAAITATAYVAPIPTITWQDALEGVQAYVAEQVPNPGVGSTKGEWAVFALNRGGVAEEAWNNKYIGNLQTYVDQLKGKLHDKKYTEYSRVVIALTSIGYDATKFTTASAVYDLVTPLLDKQDNGAYWAEWQGNNGTAFALLALDTHGYLDTDEGNAARAAFIASLKANQLENGGWPISGDTSDLDVTAAAVYALAPYYLDSSKLTALGSTVTYAEVKAMVDNGLAFLSGKQNEQGGLGSPEADVWAIIALTTLGRDPATETAFVKDGGTLVDDLLRYYDETTGGFKHEADGTVNQMSSEQAAYGLAAYSRFKNGKTALYDMSDVELTLPEEVVVPVTGITVEPTTASVEVGKTVTLTATVEPANATDKTVTWESKDTSTATVIGGVVTGVKAGTVKIVASAGGKSAECTVTVTGKSDPPGPENNITVSMRLIGAEKATKDVDLGQTPPYMPDYVTWIVTTTYTLDKGATVYDLWTTATADAGVRSIGAENNYVATVYAPDSLGGYALSEFTNGKRSGWMYTINGKHPGYGLVEQTLHDGDVVIWHYVNDYSYEVEDWFGDDPEYPPLGDGTYWNRWLKAPDTFGGKGGGLKGTGGGGGGSDIGLPGLIELTPEVVDGEAKASVTTDKITEAMAGAEKGAPLTVSVVTEGAEKVVLELPADAVKTVADAGIGLNVQTELGTVKTDAATLKAAAEAGKAMAVTMEKHSDGSTTVDVTADGKTVAGDVKVEFPAKDGQVLVIVNADGTEEVVKKSVTADGKLYAVIPAGATVKAVDGQPMTFGDVKETDWFFGAVNFVTSRGIFQGTGEGFEPGTTMSRAMLATVLYRLEGAVAKGGSTFGDVASDAWYADAAAWAQETGIITGTDKGFEPDAPVTREQIATMLYRFMKHLGYDVSGTADLTKFPDGGETSGWAGDAMAWAVSVGLFQGDDTGALNPGGEATRAQVATLFERMIGLIVK